MDTTPVPSSGREQRFQEVVASYLEEVEAGRAEDLPALLALYPDLAEEIAAFFTNQKQLVSLVGRQREWTSAEAGPELRELGDFRIRREVGRGGMGVVYEAEQVSLHRQVALKVLPFAATMDPRHLQRFHNEAQAAACLHHTNIVPVYFVGVERGMHFYAMQFIDGQPLSELIRQLWQMEKKAAPAAAPEKTAAYEPPPDDALATRPTGRTVAEATPLTSEGRRGRDYYRKVAELGVQAAEALDHAHQLGIVHRDIKPGNLMLDGLGRLWVTDFGLAHMRQSDCHLTTTGQLVGTPRYMSPEQALAQRVPIDHRTDVYSLGATLYELLTLHPAFGSENRQELLQQIALEEPVRPRRLNKAIPAELETIALKAMEKRPQDRYATAQELADDLRRWLRDQPIRARRPSWVQVARRWARRHKPVVWSAAVVLLLVAVLGGGEWLRWIQKRAAADRQAELALRDTERWQEEGKMPEALAAMRPAQALVDGGALSQELAGRVRRRRTDLEMASRLEAIRIEHTTLTEDRVEFGPTDEEYKAAFAAYGIDVSALDSPGTAERIRGSSIRMELVVALDDWAMGPQATPKKGDKLRKDLLALARAVDTDEGSNRVRNALERLDHQDLKKLAASEQAVKLPPSTLALLGSALGQAGAVEEAVSLLEQARRQHPGDFWINLKLAYHLRRLKQPRREEALRFFTAAQAIRPRDPKVYHHLGFALVEKNALEDGVAAYNQAILLKPDYAEAYLNLGQALQRKGAYDQAFAAWKKAIEIQPDLPEAHNNLVYALLKKGELNEAMAACEKAIRLRPDFAEAHYNRGNILGRKRLLDEAIAEYQATIRLKPDYAEAYCNLGDLLMQKGRFSEALAARRRGHELGSPRPDWRYASAKWVREAEQKVELDRKLPAILDGKAQPADAVDALNLAGLCQQPYKRLYARAASLYVEGFKAQPELAEKPQYGLRYLAARAAAMAGSGQGEDAARVDEPKRASWRRQALDWLWADLRAWRKFLDKEPDKARPDISRKMQKWLKEPDFASVRGAESLGKLPEAERPGWLHLWEEVEALRQQAAAPKTTSPVRPKN